MKKLSIIIPVYNTPRDLLKKSLESCQGRDDIEVIVIDDGSTIDYKDIIENYSVKYIKTVNRGVSHARNIGISMAEGEYITFLDSDDTIILTDKIIEELNKIDIVIARNYILKDKIRPNNYTLESSRFVSPDLVKRDMLVLEGRMIECTEPVWGKFYRREYLQKSQLQFNEALQRGEDVIFNYEAYSGTSSIYSINEFGYNYRANNESITRSFDQIMDVTTFRLVEEFEKLFKRLNIKDENYVQYVFRLIIRLMRKYYVHLSREEYEEKIELLFNNVIINYYLEMVDTSNFDIYKRQLKRLVLLKDKTKLYDYLRDVCDHNLLKK